MLLFLSHLVQYHTTRERRRWSYCNFLHSPRIVSTYPINIHNKRVFNKCWQYKQRVAGPGHDGADVPVPAGDGDDAGVRRPGALRAAPAQLGALRTLRAHRTYTLMSFNIYQMYLINHPIPWYPQGEV